MSVLVSICIPTLNGSKFLHEALNSVSKQTYNNLEVIVSDDASNDETLRIVEAFKTAVSFPVYIFKHQPSGIGANWNNCIKYTKGKYIKFLFQDDVLYPDCISKMVEISERDEKIGLVYCKRSFIYEPHNEEQKKWLYKYATLHIHWDSIEVKTGYLRGAGYLKDKNLLRVPFNKIGEPTAVLITKSSFKIAGYFNEDLKQALDVEFWYRLMKDFKIGFVNEELVYFRLHKNQASANNHFKGISEIEKLEMFAYRNLFFKLHPRNQWELFKKYSRVGYYFRKLKNLKML